MGCFPKMSGCSCDTPEKDNNPNPREFTINNWFVVGNFVVISVTYPNCTNYKGEKILVFEGVSAEKILCSKFLDPHFCEGNHISPVARFEPTEKGWDMAFAFMIAMKE